MTDLHASLLSPLPSNGNSSSSKKKKIERRRGCFWWLRHYHCDKNENCTGFETRPRIL